MNDVAFFINRAWYRQGLRTGHAWYHEAADAGDVGGEYRRAVCTTARHSQDYMPAMNWYRRSADRGI